LENQPRIAVLGLGYVGCVTAACFADLGYHVIGVDPDEFKVKSVLDGCAPFYEPGLEDLVRAAAKAGRLRASTSNREALRDADIVMICVGTPSAKNGNLGLDQLRRACADVAAVLPERRRPLVVAVRSTVFPGTCAQIVRPLIAGFAGVSLVANPEFLREGTAVADFLEPSLLVIGGDDPGACAQVAELYSSLPVEPSLVSLETAEMIKYACNAFHAVKIAFANEIGALSESLSVDPLEVMQTLCRDQKLNTSGAYLKPGFAFGGSCLAKDLRALLYRASRLDLALPLLESALPSNLAHLNRAIRLVQDSPFDRIGIYGLAFKENTDDLRDSAVVTLIEQLLGKGRNIRVCDPHIKLDQIYGTNRTFIFNAVPHIARLMSPTLEDVLQWCDGLVVAQTPDPVAMERIRCSGVPVIDLVLSDSRRGLRVQTDVMRTGNSTRA
jgi:GDP-mannose 6-dehydrogenase